MKETKTLVNRVEQSGILTFDLATLLPKEPVAEFDLKPFLFKEMVLMEKSFREALKETDWQQYNGKVVAVHCSNEALIPMWAYMLISTHLQPVAKKIYFGNLLQAESAYVISEIEKINPQEFSGKRVVVKGCGEKMLLPDVFLAITLKLMPVVASLMYGEPCSAVPVYKQLKPS